MLGHTDGPSCVLQFAGAAVTRSRAGLNDVTTRLVAFQQYARAFGCAAVMPRPATLLDPLLNGGRNVDDDVWWSRYYLLGQAEGQGYRAVLGGQIPGSAKPKDAMEIDAYEAFWSSLLESVPLLPKRQVRTTHVVGRVPSVSEMATWKAGFASERGALHVLHLDVGDLPMYGNHSLQGEIEHVVGERVRPIWPHPSEAVLRRAHAVSTALFNGSQFMTLHLRRGNRLSQYNPPACAEVPAVLWGVVHSRLRSGCPCVDAIFVYTEERSADYLDRLRSDLRVFFRTAHLETDVPPHLKMPRDNFFDFEVLKRISRTRRIGRCHHAEHSPAVGGLDCAPSSRLEQPFGAEAQRWRINESCTRASARRVFAAEESIHMMLPKRVGL